MKHKHYLILAVIDGTALAGSLTAGRAFAAEEGSARAGERGGPVRR